MKVLNFLLILVLVSLTRADTDVEKVIKSVQKKYKKVEVIYVEFKQINRFKLTGIENEIFGTLWLTQKNKFRLETEDQTIVSNGETYWRYNKLENQVLIDKAKKSQQDIFLNNFLFNISDLYYSQILSQQKQDGQKIYEVKLTPKTQEESFFQYLKVWIEDDNWNLRRVIYVDYNDNETEYKIQTLEIEPSLPGGIFTFEVPQGIEAIDLRF